MSTNDDAPQEDGHSLSVKFIGLALVISAFLGFLDQKSFSFHMPFLGRDPLTDKPYSLSTIIPSGNLEKNIEVINKNETPVFDDIDGEIIGLQMKGEKGRIINGPIRRSKEVWWKINYEKSPDGWVESSRLTSHLGLYLAMNFLPMTISWLRPIAALLAMLFLVLIFVVIKKRKEVLETYIQKKKLERGELDDQSEIKTASEIILEENKTIGESENVIGENPETYEDLSEPTIGIKNDRWANIKRLINSYQVEDWRQSLREADALLDDMLNRMAYSGESVSDRLSKVEPSDFLTLNEAKEADRLSKKIFYLGENYPISQEEVKQILSLYEKVFEEFYFI